MMMGAFIRTAGGILRAAAVRHPVPGGGWLLLLLAAQVVGPAEGRPERRCPWCLPRQILAQVWRAKPWARAVHPRKDAYSDTLWCRAGERGCTPAALRAGRGGRVLRLRPRGCRSDTCAQCVRGVRRGFACRGEEGHRRPRFRGDRN